jgi:hypothetical protein
MTGVLGELPADEGPDTKANKGPDREAADGGHGWIVARAIVSAQLDRSNGGQNAERSANDHTALLPVRGRNDD